MSYSSLWRLFILVGYRQRIKKGRQSSLSHLGFCVEKNLVVSLRLKRNDLAQSLIFYLPNRERNYIFPVPQVNLREALPNNQE